jgi:hypothetical protein
MVKKKAKKKILPMVVVVLAVMAIAAAPALAKDSKKPKSHSSAQAAAAVSRIPETAQAPKPGEFDSKPGPAWLTVGGTVKNVEGDTYTVETYEGNQIKLRVGKGTKYIKQKNVGDTVRAEITRGGFANSIQ